MELIQGNYNHDQICSGIGNDKASSVKLMRSEIVLYEYGESLKSGPSF